jgi:hypothetical protein
MSNEERLPIADIENEALVPRAILVIRQQALHEARCLDLAAPGSHNIILSALYSVPYEFVPGAYTNANDAPS